MPGPRVVSHLPGVVAVVAVREARVAVVVVHPPREHRALVRREPTLGFRHPEPAPLVVAVVVAVVVVVTVAAANTRGRRRTVDRGVRLVDAARLQHAKPRRQLLVEPRRD